MAYQSEIEKLEQRFNEKPEQWFAALADAYRKNGDVDFAIEVLKEWIPKRENYTSGYIVLGRCYLDKEEDTQAHETFRQVIELDPENIIALKSLSEIATRREDLDEAREWLTRLLEADPMNDEARDALEALPGGAAEPEPAEAAAEPVEGFGLGLDASEVATPEVSSVQAGVAELSGEEPSESAEEPPAEAPAEPSGVGADEPTMLVGSDAASAPAETHDVPQAAEDDVSVAAETARMDGLADVDSEDAGAIETVRMDGVEAPEEEPTVVEGLHVSEIPTEPMEPVEGSSGEEATVAEMSAYGFEPAKEEEKADVESAEGFVTVDGSGVEAAEPVSKQSFDEDLDWDEGDRTSKQVSQEDIAAAEEEHAEGLVTVDGASSEPVESLGVETYENAIELTEGQEEAAPTAHVDTGGVFQEDGSAFGAGALDVPEDQAAPELPEEESPGFDPDATAPTDAEELASATGGADQPLDLILPPKEDETVAARVEPPVEIEPEPAPEPVMIEPSSDDASGQVVTRTMAEVYLRQGHTAEAKEIYRKLLDRDPTNDEVRAKLAELEEQQVAGTPSAPAPSARGERFSVAMTGGVSARDMLVRIAGSAAPDMRAARPSMRPAQPARSSFDEFFGASPGDEADATEPAPEAPPSEGEGDPGFSDWLKGLKT